jgi:hypothetical protein
MTDKKYNQQKYNKQWANNNKEHANYLRARSAARSFIRKKATKDDLEELREMIELRLSEINEQA